MEASRPELIPGKKYVPSIDPEFAKYEQKYGLILHSVLVVDICDENNSIMCNSKLSNLRTEKTTELSNDDLTRMQNIEGKNREKCLKQLNDIIQWSALKRQGLVSLKIKKKAMKFQNSKFRKFNPRAANNAKKRPRSSSSASENSPVIDTEKQIKPKPMVVKKKKKPTKYAHRPGVSPLPSTSKQQQSVSEIEKYIKADHSKKPHNSSDLVNPTPIPTTMSSNKPSTIPRISNYKIPRLKPKLIRDENELSHTMNSQNYYSCESKESQAQGRKNESSKDENYVKIQNIPFKSWDWKSSDSDSDSEEEMKVQLIPDPTLEDMINRNIAYKAFVKFIENPETIEYPASSLKDLNSSARDDSVIQATYIDSNLLSSVGKKVAWWLQYNEDPSEYPLFVCPELEEDSISSITIGEDDISGDVDEMNDEYDTTEDSLNLTSISNSDSDSEIKAKKERRKRKDLSSSRVEDPLLAMEYFGAALLTSLIGINRRFDKSATHRPILNLKPGSNYERPSFKAQCGICELICQSVKDLVSHLKSEVHRRNFSNFSFELASEEEKVYAESIDFEDLRKVRREERRQVRHDFKDLFKQFFESPSPSQSPKITGVYSLSTEKNPTNSSLYQTINSPESGELSSSESEGIEIIDIKKPRKSSSSESVQILQLLQARGSSSSSDPRKSAGRQNGWTT